MNIPIILSLSTIIVFSTFLGTSYGAPALREHPSLPEVSLQLLVRNSEGQLVAYIEPSEMYIRNLAKTHEFLDGIKNKTTIIKDEKSYELIQFKKVETYKRSGQLATYGINYKGDFVLLFRHDGYIIQPNDKLTIHWKILRAPL
ncbi:MAG TPA: hypothetical protein VD699_02515 [Nitrosopumilaceae archaeon]|nr:hypothetical protein [Nitrosopumilaceae archaeon]